MHESITLILTISLIIVLSPFFSKVLRIPITPVEIIFGAVFGYAGFLHEEHLFDIVAEFGFLYLIFIAGMEINLKSTLKTPRLLLQKIIAYLTILYGFSIAITLYFDLSKIFMVLMPLISVGLIATLSREYGKTPWLALSMTAGAIGEIVSIGFLTLTSATLDTGIGFGLMQTIFALVFFLLFMFLLFLAMELLFWWFPEVVTSLMPHDDKKEQDIRLSMGILFVLLAVMLYLDLELAFGAFLAGIFIPTFFEHKKELPEKLGSFGFGFLVPVFFIHIGASFHLEALLMDGLIVKASLITLAMTVMRVVASLVFIKDLGVRDSILMGLSHSMPLTLLIAMATLAYNAQSINEVYYYALILAALFQAIVIMIVIKLVNNYKNKKKESLETV